MINEWLSNKFRFGANLAFFVLGVSCLILPAVLSVLVLVLALVLDYMAFSFKKKGAAE